MQQAFAGHSYLGLFEHHTGLPRSYAIIVFSLVYLVLVFANIAGIGEFLSNLAGFVVPGYFSLLALRTKDTKDDTLLLTYWVVFAFLNVIEFFSVVILYWIPFYFLFKTLFLIYIAIPSTGGALSIYATVILPVSEQFFGRKSFTEKIDDVTEGVTTAIEK